MPLRKLKCIALVIVVAAFVGLPLVQTSTALAGLGVRIPYSVIGAGWWSGLAITNYGDSALQLHIDFTPANGGPKTTVSPAAIASGAVWAATLSDLYTPPTGIVQAWLLVYDCLDDGGIWDATLFVGNNVSGFAFQNYTGYWNGILVDNSTLPGCQ